MFVSEHVGVWRWADDARGVWILVSLELIWLATGQFQTSLIQEVAWGLLAMQLLGLTLQQMRVWGWLRGWEEGKRGGSHSNLSQLQQACSAVRWRKILRNGDREERKDRRTTLRLQQHPRL